MRLLLTTDTIGGVWSYAIELARALVGADPCVRPLPPLPPGEASGWGDCPRAGWGEGALRATPTSKIFPSTGTPGEGREGAFGGADILVCPESASGGCTRPPEPTQRVFAKTAHPVPIQIALATMGAPLTPSQLTDLQSLPHVTLFESQYKLEWMPNPWPDIESAAHRLLDIEQQFQPDLIHLNAYPHASLPWHAPVVVAAHSCVLSWWQAVKREPAPPEWNTYRTRVREGLRAADLVIAPSRAMLDAAQLHYGPLQSTQVIPNARTPSLFRAAKKQPFILSAGRLWDEAKNTAALARIAPRLPWPVHVAGEGADFLPNVKPLGRLSQPEMADHLSRAAIYALPARYEPFGLSVLEAALSGCALVLGDIPSLRENWSGAAQFVDPFDDNALLAALNDLISNDSARAALSAAVLNRARRFSIHKFATEYWSAYQRLTAAPTPHFAPVERIPVCGS